MSGPSAAAFLRKRKDKRPAVSRQSTQGSSNNAQAGPSHLSSQPSTSKLAPKEEPSATSTPTNQGDIVEIKLFSASSSSVRDSRYNLMKLNYAREFDPRDLPGPILLNRKQPGPRAPPTFALDEEGNIIGKYKYDEDMKPVLGEDGLQIIDIKEKADLDLIGGSEAKKVKKKPIKEVYQQDKDIIRLRREEATPWILETGNPSQEGEGQISGKMPEHWVGRFVDPHSLPTVLFINDGQSDGFKVIPLGRTYKFEPERPFKVLDPDASHKLYEELVKNKAHDRWAQREGGRMGTHVPGANGAEGSVKRERDLQVRQEARMRAMEQRIKLHTGDVGRRVKAERFDDDNRREGRALDRGMDGGAGEELDYDEKEDFQDDDDVNTFYRDKDEEEEAKVIEDRLKKEYRLANATVGINTPDVDDIEDDSFAGKGLTYHGKRMRKLINDRKEDGDDLFNYSDEDSDSDEETPEKVKEKEADKGKGKEAPSADRGRGVQAQNRTARGATSPSINSRNQSPTPGKGVKRFTAPPSGASFMAQRATSSRGVSPASRSRHASPRAASPDGTPRSPRAASPAMSTSRAQSPVETSGSRAGSPSVSTNPALKKVQGRESAPSPGGTSQPKRKQSPAPSTQDPPRKKKKGSNTPTPAPEDMEPFEGMITREELVTWFKSRTSDRVPMSEVITAFKPRIIAPPTAELQAKNQALFLAWVKSLTVKGGGGFLQIKAEFA